MASNILQQPTRRKKIDVERFYSQKGWQLIIFCYFFPNPFFDGTFRGTIWYGIEMLSKKCKLKLTVIVVSADIIDFTTTTMTRLQRKALYRLNR